MLLKIFSTCVAVGLAAVALPASAAPISVEGVLVGGGGVDDSGVSVALSRADAAKMHRLCRDRIRCQSWFLPDNQGKTLWLWCGACKAAWFEPDEESGGESLKKHYTNKKVRVSFAEEMNHDRIVGPGEVRLLFLKELHFIR